MSAPDTDPRQRILELLKLRGPLTAAELAEPLRVTAMAVRQHLAQLEAEGLVGFRRARRPVGRPAHVFHLTERARERFPDSHGELAVGLLDAMEDAFGADGLRRVVAARAARQRVRYAARVDACAPLAARVDALCALREAEGYMARVETDDDGTLLLVENHCPICEAATRCRALCAGELELFREVLGPDTHVERTEHLLAGARRCVYRISPR